MSDTIRVLHLLPLGCIGGQEQYVASICSRAGAVTPQVEHMVGFSMGGGEVEERIRAAGTPTFHLGLKSGYDLPRALRLRVLLRREAVDVVHSHGPLPVLNLMARFSRAPVQVLTDHGPTLGSQVKREWRRALFLRAMSRLVDRYVAISQGMAETLIARERIPRERIVTIYNGVDVEGLRRSSRLLCEGIRPALPFEPGGRLIGTVSRLVTDKRIHLFLEVCAALADRDPEVRFIIAGDGPLRGDLERRAAELGLAGRVHFLGRRSDVPDLLAAMDLYLCTSMGEAFSIALLEAMALGVPIAAFDVEGVREAVFHGRTGLLAENGDVPALARACAAILDDAGQRRAMSEEALKVVRERFELDDNIRALEKLYRGELKRKRGR